MARIRSGDEVGVTRRIWESLAVWHSGANRPASSSGSSGRMIPSTPALAAAEKKSCAPKRDYRVEIAHQNNRDF